MISPFALCNCIFSSIHLEESEEDLLASKEYREKKEKIKKIEKQIYKPYYRMESYNSLPSLNEFTNNLNNYDIFIDYAGLLFKTKNNIHRITFAETKQFSEYDKFKKNILIFEIKETFSIKTIKNNLKKSKNIYISYEKVNVKKYYDFVPKSILKKKRSM